MTHRCASRNGSLLAFRSRRVGRARETFAAISINNIATFVDYIVSRLALKLQRCWLLGSISELPAALPAFGMVKLRPRQITVGSHPEGISLTQAIATSSLGNSTARGARILRHNESAVVRSFVRQASQSYLAYDGARVQL
jgi:hypothetical protein